jgi:hypothetical protein
VQRKISTSLMLNLKINKHGSLDLSTLGMKGITRFSLLTCLPTLGTNKSLCISRGYSTDSLPHIVYKPRKNKSIQVYFPLHAFYVIDVFTSIMSESKSDIYMDNIYTVYIKVRYNKDNFFRAGNQFGFIYNSQVGLHILF